MFVRLAKHLALHHLLPTLMAQLDFSISITSTAVDVVLKPSAKNPHAKLNGFIFIIGLAVITTCAVLFSPGKHGNPSMWHLLTSTPSGSPVLFIPCSLLLLLGLFTWQAFRYARAAWPSDEHFHCDKGAITIERIPWLDFSNQTWRTYTYPLSEVRSIRFAVVASARGRAYWGLRFQADGRKWVLPGLEAPEGKQILSGLRALGADVPEDPRLDVRIKQTLDTRSGDTTWMDRSWMDSNKQ
jgi:hypothetical protein